MHPTLETTASEELKEDSGAGTWGMKEKISQDEAGESARAKVRESYSGPQIKGIEKPLESFFFFSLFYFILGYS